jgi:hypothetical protein
MHNRLFIFLIFNINFFVLPRQEKIISALAKSIIWGAFPIDHSPIILEQFVSHGKYIEELIRAFLTKLRTKAGSDEWRYILETLKAVTKSFLTSSYQIQVPFE